MSTAMEAKTMKGEQCQATNSHGERCGLNGTQVQPTFDGRFAWVCSHHAHFHVVVWSETDVPDTSDALGQTIRELRQLRDWSQTQLYKRCGVHPSTINSYETGEASPSVQKVARIATAFDASPSDLLKDAGL